MLLHKYLHSSALVRLPNNPWTASASQPIVRAAIAAALQSLYQRVRGATYDRRPPSTSVLDLLPSGLRVSHFAALHLSAPDHCSVRADDLFGPRRIAAPTRLPNALGSAQLATIVYQTAGVLPSSIPINPCCIVPAALVGRAGPAATKAERDADSRLLFDRVLFDRPIGVTTREGAMSAKLENNIVFRSQRTFSPLSPPPPSSSSRHISHTPVSPSNTPAIGVNASQSTPIPMIRRQVSVVADSDSNDSTPLDEFGVKSIRSPPPLPPPPPPPMSMHSSTTRAQTPVPTEFSSSEPIRSCYDDAVMADTAPAAVDDSWVVAHAFASQCASEESVQEPHSDSILIEAYPAHHNNSFSEHVPMSSEFFSHAHEVAVDPVPIDSQSPASTPPPPPPPLPILLSNRNSMRSPQMFGAEFNADIQKCASSAAPVDAENVAASTGAMHAQVAESTSCNQHQSDNVSGSDIGHISAATAHSLPVATTPPLPSLENQLNSTPLAPPTRPESAADDS